MPGLSNSIQHVYISNVSLNDSENNQLLNALISFSYVNSYLALRGLS